MQDIFTKIVRAPYQYHGTFLPKWYGTNTKGNFYQKGTKGGVEGGGGH